MGEASVQAVARAAGRARRCRCSARPKRRSTPSTASPVSTGTSSCCSRRRRRCRTLAEPDTEGARLLIEGVLAERRKVLTEMESKALLAAFHIPVTRTMLARNANEAMLIASQLGYPVALKIDSPDIAHKSDVQGVVLDVQNAMPGARPLPARCWTAVGRGAARGAHQWRHGAADGRPQTAPAAGAARCTSA